jgi:ABC-type multidrug transport system fused ATPase/permease subunit
MTSFVHIDYSTTHPGVNRVELAIDAAQQLRQQFSGTRGLAKLLLSAVVAAVMVVAYQVMDSVAEGHLLVIWTAMWAIAFVALALFAGTAVRFAAQIRAGFDVWSQQSAQKSADERLLRTARSDPRVMADLQAAITRSETDNSSQPA